MGEVYSWALGVSPSSRKGERERESEVKKRKGMKKECQKRKERKKEHPHPELCFIAVTTDRVRLTCIARSTHNRQGRTRSFLPAIPSLLFSLLFISFISFISFILSSSWLQCPIPLPPGQSWNPRHLPLQSGRCVQSLSSMSSALVTPSCTQPFVCTVDQKRRPHPVLPLSLSCTPHRDETGQYSEASTSSKKIASWLVSPPSSS